MAAHNILKKAGSEEIIISLADTPKRFTDIIKSCYENKMPITPSTLSRRINELIEGGIIDIEYDKFNRMSRYKLTDKGIRYYIFLKISELAEKFVLENNEINDKVVTEYIRVIWKILNRYQLLNTDYNIKRNLEILIGIIKHNFKFLQQERGEKAQKKN